MPQQAIIVTGDKEINRNLARFEANVQKKAIRKATRQAAKFVLADARAMAPRDTGLLESSLKVRAIRRTRTGKVGHSVQTGERTFGGETFYGAFQELGTRYMQEDPFMRPALWSNEMPVKQEFINEIRAEIARLR